MITASRFKDVLAFSKKGESLQARENYMAEIVCERLTGEAITTPSTYAMQWGVDVEPYARSAYEVKTGRIINETPFVAKNDYAGASPDGLFENGGLEIKCPANSMVHIRTILEGMPDAHIPQVQGQIWCADLKWVDFVSYDPRMPENLQLYVQTIQRDDEYIERLAEEVSKFNDEVETIIGQLKNIKLI